MEVKETKKFPYFKIFLGILCLIAVAVAAFAVEKTISTSVKDVVINKSDITGEVSYIRVRPLSTRIMAVRDSEGGCRLAFEECFSCYYNDGVNSTFTDTGESVICDNCGCETYYDDMGLLSDGCTPIPILKDYIIDGAQTITIPKDFLERCKEMLDVLRIGKGNYANVYGRTADYMNMEITEASDMAVSYDDGESDAPQSEYVTVDELWDRVEDITKLYNGYQNDVTINASQSDIGIFTACYKEFLALCDELAETDISDERALEISRKFDEIQERIREIGKNSAK